MADSWLVVGLGNPGPDYSHTRHNVGQMVIDLLAERAGVQRKRHSKAVASVAETRVIGGPKVILAFPESFMNLSGGPVSALMDYYAVPIERVIVLHDDLDLPEWAVRLKQGGGHGGHNGLRDIIRARGPEFLRVRLGIGRPPGRQSAADFVLRKYPSADRESLALQLDEGADAVEYIIRDGFSAAQQRVHAPS